MTYCNKLQQINRTQDESKDSEEDASKSDGPQSSVVHPEEEPLADQTPQKKKIVSPKTRAARVKKDQKEIDITKHGRTLIVQHWFLTYFDRICFVINCIFYIIFSFSVVVVPPPLPPMSKY